MNYTKNYDSKISYCRSKIANILFTRELQAKMDWAGMYGYTYSLHPGVIPTELGRDMGVIYPVMKVLLAPFFFIFLKTAWEGAQTTLHLVFENE